MQAASQSVTNMRAHEARKACEPRSAIQKANHNLTYASHQAKPHTHIGKKRKPMTWFSHGYHG